MDIERQVAALAKKLRAVGTRERAEQEKRYLKSDLAHFGAGVPKVRAVAKAWLRAHPAVTHDELVGVARALFDAPWYELRAVAVMLLHARVELLTKKDVPLIEGLIRRAKTWALVDELAPRVMGALVERERSLQRVLRRWAKDSDFWVRRAALLSLLLPLRRGEGDFELFAELAVPMLGEKEFFVRKAIGWILRDVSRKRPALAKGFVRAHGARMSGLTLREATKYLDRR
ncbi:MAG TPA: DNA alkylation repair protein [Polyangiaceae bacterium]